MDSTSKYIVWIVVIAVVIGGGFFVYKKMHADITTPPVTLDPITETMPAIPTPETPVQTPVA